MIVTAANTEKGRGIDQATTNVAVTASPGKAACSFFHLVLYLYCICSKRSTNCLGDCAGLW